MNPILYDPNAPVPGPDFVLADMLADDGTTMRVWIRSQDLKPILIRDENSGEIGPVLRWQTRHLFRYLPWCSSLEDYDFAFVQDVIPALELDLLTKATYAFLEFTRCNPKSDRKAVLHAVISIIWGRGERVPAESLRRRLEKLMRNAPRALDNLENFTDDGYFTAGPRHLR